MRTEMDGTIVIGGRRRRRMNMMIVLAIALTVVAFATVWVNGRTVGYRNGYASCMGVFE